jgi:hypothetical protein
MGQCSVFVRNREQFAQPPFNLKIDEAFVARLTDFISTLALKGLAQEALTSTDVSAFTTEEARLTCLVA